MSGAKGLNDLGPFFEGLGSASSRVLFLDYDGTLAPFKVRRDRAYPYPGIRDALSAIIESGLTRLLIISGRATEDLIPLLGLEKLPEIFGAHGFERLFPNGRREVQRVDEAALMGLEEAHRWVSGQGLEPRWEQKPGSGALHFRGMDPREGDALRSRAGERFSSLAEEHGLSLKPFDWGLELRARGPDKGSAVETVLGEAVPGAVAAYLGDDLTDEDAFAALKGRGLSVLVRDEFRSTGAQVWIRPPDELLRFLNLWLVASGKPARGSAAAGD